jgi:hypothetical protein
MADNDKLYILWTSKEPETFDEMVFMYAFNAKQYGWWKEMILIIWGASAKLVDEDEVVKGKIRELINAGIHVSACQACARDLGVTETLENLGVEVVSWGKRLTEVIKSGSHLITI